jgi:multidrug resistance efflux pump
MTIEELMSGRYQCSRCAERDSEVTAIKADLATANRSADLIAEERERYKADLATLRQQLADAIADTERLVRLYHTDVAALRQRHAEAVAVMETVKWPSSEANGRLLLNVDAAAWTAWLAKAKLT